MYNISLSKRRKASAAVKTVPKIVFYIAMFGLSYIMLYPFLYMIATSFMSNEDLNNLFVRWIPRSLCFSNYTFAQSIIDYWATLKNTVLVTVIGTLGQLISCSMAGYALARFKAYGSRVIFFIVLLAMIIPIQTIVVPQYLIYLNLGWMNTYFPLLVPCFFGYGVKGALFIYIFRQFFMAQPKELEEAARVDGCGFLRTFISIIVPCAKTSYVVVTVLALVWHWSDYFEPSMYLNKTALAMVSMRLQNIATVLSMPAEVLADTYSITDQTAINNAVLMAGVTMTVIPVLIMYFFLQKQFIQGVERSGLTGE